jgi:hypothetical protein
MTKPHQDEEFLRREIAAGGNSRSISAKLGVSWKLVEIYLREYKIEHTPYTWGGK